MIKYDSIYDIHDHILYHVIYFINGIYNQKYFLIVKITYDNFFIL